MPAPKKAGSARRSPAKATAPAAEKKTRAKRGTRAKKTFLLYAVDGNELSFVCEAVGATGQIAVINAVKTGSVAPDTPIVPLAPRAVQRVVEIEAKERDVLYKVKAGKKRATRRTAAAKPEPVDSPDAAPAPSAPATSARKSARTKVAAPASPAPGERSSNPFAS